MGNSRIPERAGVFGGGKLKSCRYCGGPITEKYRRTFCSDACVNEHKVRTQPAYAAECVEKRDHGVCSSCGLDCTKLLERMLDERQHAIRRYAMATHLEHRCHHSGTWGTYDCGHDDCFNATVARLMDHRSWYYCHDIASHLEKDQQYAAACLAAHLPPHLRLLKRRLWEMDHVVPVVEGGADCGLDNLRTLCWACHHRETAALAKRRSKTKPKPKTD